MKKHLLVAMLMLLLSFSACALDTIQQTTGYNLAGLNFNQVAGSSGAVASVNIKDNSFQPSVLNVQTNTKVQWHNQDSVVHTVVSDVQGLFESGAILPGETFSFTFNTPGSYGYHCGIHQGMQGAITVTGAAQSGSVSRSSATADAVASGSSQAGSQDIASDSWTEQPMSQDDLAASSDLHGSSDLQGLQGLQNLQAGSTTGAVSSIQALQISNPAIASGAVQSPSQASGTDLDLAAVQKFSQYYVSSSEEPADQITAPSRINLNDVQPETLYFGSAQKAVSYDQYQTYALGTGTNSLWISGTSSWTQYAVVPLGSQLNMIAITPSGGHGQLYEIYPDGSLSKNSYTFYAYNQIGFYADKVGEHQLFFNIAGQPSNVIVIDVMPYQQTYHPSYSLAAITIRSTWLRGFNVYVDGSYQATEGMTGDVAGTVTMNVPGDQYHNIAIDGSGATFSDYKYFKSGYAYKLNI